VSWIDATLILFLGLVIHEICHAIGYAIFGHFPKFRFNWFTIDVYSKRYVKLQLWKMYIILIFGVVSGYLFINWMGTSTNLILLYLLFSSGDLISIYTILAEGNPRMTVLDLAKKQFKEVLKYA
jgi:hypothetical protein